MRDYLETQIAMRRQRLAALDHERSTVMAEIRAYEDALAHVDEDATVASGQTRKEASKRSSRLSNQESLNLSPTWIALLRRLASFKHFNASEVILVARELHKEQSAIKEQSWSNVRSQLSIYTKRGIIMRLGGGNYRLSDKTKTALTVRKEESGQNSRTDSRLLTEEFGPELPALAQNGG